MFGFLSGKNCGNAYRQLYAVGCQNQWERYGHLSTLFHSYEAVFLYCLASDLGLTAKLPMSSPVCCQQRRRCEAASVPEELRRFCAAFAMLLASIKIDDDVADSNSMFAKLLRTMLRKKIAESRRYFASLDPRFEETLQRILARHLQLEKAGGADVSLSEFQHATADGFGYLFKLFGEAFSPGEPRFESIGRELGAAIIAFDCAVDWTRDRKSGDFNPLGSRAALRDALFDAQHRLANIGWTICSMTASSGLSVRVIQANFKRLGRIRSALSEGHLAKQARPRAAPVWRRVVWRRGDCDCCCPLDGCDCPVDCADFGNCHGCVPCDVCCWSCGPECSSEKQKQNKKATSSEPHKKLIGKTGKTICSLNPSGMVSIDGQEVVAQSQAEWIEAGARVTVVEQNQFGVIVQRD